MAQPLCPHSWQEGGGEKSTPISLKRLPRRFAPEVVFKVFTTWILTNQNGSPLSTTGGPEFLPENPMDSGAWRGIVHGVAKSNTTE